MLKLIALIPLLPLLGVAVNGLWGARMSRRAVGLVACGVVLAVAGGVVAARRREGGVAGM